MIRRNGFRPTYRPSLVTTKDSNVLLPWLLGGIILCLIMLIWQRIEIEHAKSQAQAIMRASADMMEKYEKMIGGRR